MTGVLFRVAAFTAASLLFACRADALSFDERWMSMYADSEVSGGKVSAKAEMLPDAMRATRADRPRARSRMNRHRGRPARAHAERRREWYKGGKKWHYVTTRSKRG